jgi:uncharacterized protein
MRFDWDEANELHISRHGVTKSEVEEALIDPLGQLVDSDVAGEELRFSQVGSTFRDRLLIVVFTIRGDATRPITAFDADSYTSRAYRQGAE